MARRRPLIAALGALLAGACSPVAVLNALAPREGARQDVLRFVAETTA